MKYLHTKKKIFTRKLSNQQKQKIQKQRLHLEIANLQIEKAHVSNISELRTVAGLWQVLIKEL